MGEARDECVGAGRQVKVAFLRLRSTSENSFGTSICGAEGHSLPALLLEAR